MAKGYILSESDVVALRQMADAIKSGLVNQSGRPAVPHDLPQAPEVYVARTPVAGIPERIGDAPGSAICEIYQLSFASGTPTLTAIDGFTKTIYNLMADPVLADSWILVARDKFGVWLVGDRYGVNGGGGGGSGIVAINAVTTNYQNIGVDSSGDDLAVAPLIDIKLLPGSVSPAAWSSTKQYLVGMIARSALAVNYRCIGDNLDAEPPNGFWTDITGEALHVLHVPRTRSINEDFTEHQYITSADASLDVTNYVPGTTDQQVKKATRTFQFSGDITPSPLTGNVNDYNPTGLSNASIIRLSGDGNHSITGIEPLRNGTVTGATFTTPIVITGVDHCLSTDDTVIVTGIGGNTAANGTWVITVLSASTFSLNSSVGNDVYTAGGTWTSTAGVDGRVLFLYNTESTRTFFLRAFNASSAVANRIAAASDITLGPYTCIALKYDSTSSYWRPDTNTGPVGPFATTGILTPATITADQNNYNPTDLAVASVLRLDADDDWTITGIAGGYPGRVLFLHNISDDYTFTLPSEDTSSTSANMFILADEEFLLRPAGLIAIQYDGTSARWRAVTPSISGHLFTAQITDKRRIAGQWLYDWEEQEITSAGAYQPKAGGRSGTATSGPYLQEVNNGLLKTPRYVHVRLRGMVNGIPRYDFDSCCDISGTYNNAEGMGIMLQSMTMRGFGRRGGIGADMVLGNAFMTASAVPPSYYCLTICGQGNHDPLNYVFTDTLTNLPTGASPLTITFRFKAVADFYHPAGGFGSVLHLGHRQGFGDREWYEVWLDRYAYDNGLLRCDVGDQQLVGSTDIVTDEQWHFCAVVYDGANLRLWVDGSWDSASTPFEVNLNYYGVFAGLDKAMTIFDGWLSLSYTSLRDVRVYASALSSGNLLTLNGGNGGDENTVVGTPVRWWKFNEDQGSVLIDSSTTNDDVVLGDSPTWVPTCD